MLTLRWSFGILMIRQDIGLRPMLLLLSRWDLLLAEELWSADRSLLKKRALLPMWDNFSGFTTLPAVRGIRYSSKAILIFFGLL
jgi:hypothetical protein